MAKLGDSSMQRYKFDKVTQEQWRALKQKMSNDFHFPMNTDIGKVEYGDRVYDWQTGIFEWEFRIDHNAKPEVGVLEFGIRRRPFDSGETNIEHALTTFFKVKAEKAA